MAFADNVVLNDKFTAIFALIYGLEHFVQEGMFGSLRDLAEMMVSGLYGVIDTSILYFS